MITSGRPVVRRSRRSPRRRLEALVLGVLGAAACAERTPEHAVIPLPASLQLDAADSLDAAAVRWITYTPHAPEAAPVARYLADLIGHSAETTPQVLAFSGPHAGASIHLEIERPGRALGAEGYELVVEGSGARATAATPAGLFYAVQTLRQLLPASVEYSAIYPRPLPVPTGRITDAPRFSWRGAMLDVARHFRSVEDVRRFIDLMALHKLNRLHLHLSDDQGWRIEVPDWPELARYGGSTEVGGGKSGFYTAAEYSALVAYAAARFVTIVPEIDMPGHTNAALASYPELNCDGIAPELYTERSVGFSSLCTDAEITYDFVDDVVREVSALTPGPYLHVGGDEARETSEEDYARFMERVQGIVEAHGKRMIAWDEVVTTTLSPGSLVQIWRPLWPAPGSPDPDEAIQSARAAFLERARAAAAAGVEFILSPADRIYLDMKYDRSTVLGLSWAGLSDVRTAYDWEPAEVFDGIPETAIAGIEAPLWSETVGTLDDLEYLAFPRLAAVSELAWSPRGGRRWEDFRHRLGRHGARWTALGVNYRRSPEIDWTLDPT